MVNEVVSIMINISIKQFCQSKDKSFEKINNENKDFFK